MFKFLNEKIVLIVGGLGTIGSALLDQMLQNDKIRQIRILDNRETELGYKLYAQESTDEKLRFIFGDIRDKTRLERAMKGVDYVYHAAAMKHVPICERNPFDAVHTNIIGTQNLIEVALDHDVESFTLISTDKAVNPTNTMGATKLIGERLIHSMYFYKGYNRTKFSAVRFGNVLNSRGSVLDLRARQRENKEKLTITDPTMTRFFMCIQDAAQLVVKASEYGKHGEIFILKMPSIRMGDLLDAYCTYYDIPNTYIKTIGPRQGEKRYEELILDGEQDLLYENENMFVKIVKEDLKLNGFNKSDILQFSSNDYLLSHDEILHVLDTIFNPSCVPNIGVGIRLLKQNK